MPHLDEGIIQAWLDGELPPSKGAELEAHTASCAPCAQRVAAARGFMAAASRILGALDDVPSGVIPHAATATSSAPVPPRLTVERGAAPHTAAKAPAARPFYRNPQFAAAAAVLLMAAGTWTVLQRSRGTPAADMPPAVVREGAAPSVQDERMDSAALGNAAPAPAVLPAASGIVAPREVDNTPKARVPRSVARAKAAPPAPLERGSTLASTRDAAANEAADRVSPPLAAAPAAVKSDAQETAKKSAASDEPKRLAVPPDSATAAEARRLAGEVRAQQQTPAADGARDRKRLELDQVQVTGASQSGATRRIRPIGCYLLGRSAQTTVGQLPERFELADVAGPTVADRVWRQVRVRAAQAGAPAWYWFAQDDGTIQLARIENGTVRQMVPVTAPGAGDLRAVPEPCGAP